MARRKRALTLLTALVALALIAGACAEEEVSGEGFTFGMVLVGPQNDRGWSQAHFEAGQYVAEKLGAEMVVLDKINSADSPDKKPEQAAQEMIDAGAQLVFLTSDDMRDGAVLAAEANPDVPMIWSSGDSAWEEGKAYQPFDNLGNVMGKMEYGKMIAGCAAGLTTQTGSIAYLGPLKNDETRRLVNSAFLGAQYCWETYRGETAPLQFTVNWIGFWFNIPGVTLDPTQVANGFFDAGADVIISGIDTTEGIDVAGQRADAGEEVWAIPYDFEGACEGKPEICLGVPYFNWGPAYLKIAEDVIQDGFTATWEWNDPDWEDLNNKETTAVGFVKGDGLSAENSETLDEFIDGLAGGDINLFEGPLNYADGSPWLAEGETATDFQIWYTEDCLEGVTGGCTGT